MSKGFRVLLQIFQVLFILAALLFMTFSFLMAYIDFGATDAEGRFIDTWILGFALLAIACSPALWSLKRGGSPAGTTSSGAYDRVAQGPSGPSQPHPSQPGGVFEPIGGSGAPAPPASSYGQPQAGGYGGPSAGGITPASPAQVDGPWGSGR
ncbi:MAG TPA: hypothetical protein VHG10_10610 [Glycomyces sp.]|nr:hypothetical protein [Glycomyces sp.]